MGHEYEAQPSVESEKEKAAVSSDSDSEIKVEKQDNEEKPQSEQAGKSDVPEEGGTVEERDVSLPPKVESEKVTVKEGVCKQVIKEGHGLGPPPRHSSCFVHYRAWTASTMHKFDDTWAEQQPQELRLGHEKKVLKGLAIGVGSMKIGEHALLHISHTLAYGKEGSFSFPNVPPAADVLYEVELIGFEEPREGRPTGEMVVEERIEAADRRKVDGNELFKEGKIAEAMQQYEMALAYMGDDFMFQLFGKYHDMAIAVKNPCHLNLAACFLKIHRFEEAIGHCSVVLAEDPKNTKALFRRGKARAELGQTDAAKDDFEKARKLEPDNKEVARELRVIAKQERELYDKQREMYKGLFKPPPSATSSQDISMLPWYSKLWQKWVAPFLFYFSKLQRSKKE
ncbi:hypothetical protein KC19_12G141600 [Ceratodon purpureus]|uniref:peptidylprolyl isomerase n=1 Tax=Ceratodon purpureus TaxID=3225 RepID=A0A8T0G9M5_CERPU|nr:hypothetical protein KC19_12G141600 [Ceratodon purpureus]